MFEIYSRFFQRTALRYKTTEILPLRESSVRNRLEAPNSSSKSNGKSISIQSNCPVANSGCLVGSVEPVQIGSGLRNLNLSDLYKSPRIAFALDARFSSDCRGLSLLESLALFWISMALEVRATNLSLPVLRCCFFRSSSLEVVLFQYRNRMHCNASGWACPATFQHQCADPGLIPRTEEPSRVAQEYFASWKFVHVGKCL